MFWTTTLQLIPVATLFGFAIPLAKIDIREHRLPNIYTISLLLVSSISLLAAAAFMAELKRYLLAAFIATAILFLGYWMSYLKLIGYGDIKLLAGMSMILSWFDPMLTLVATAIAFGLASLVGTVGLVRRRLTLKGSIALGPYLLFGFGSVALMPTIELLFEVTVEA